MLRSYGYLYGAVVTYDRPVASWESSLPPDFPLAKTDQMDESDIRETDPTGLMVIRAWVEEGSSAPLRVQIRLTTDVSKGYQRTIVLSDVQAASAAVEDWLTDVMAGPTSPG
jgi:hypothetical protein